jgi:pimeloyl-ACP methyl ester carboxylesterase
VKETKQMQPAGDALQRTATMSNAVSREYLEFLTKLGADKFYVLGHSAGTYWAVQIASQGVLDSNRCLGVALMGCFTDVHHPDADLATTMSLKSPAMPMSWATVVKLNKHARYATQSCFHGWCPCFCCWKQGPSWCGPCPSCCARTMMGKGAGGQMYADKTKDIGFADKYTATCKDADGCSPAVAQEMDRDDFFVAKTLQSYVYGYTAPGGDKDIAWMEAPQFAGRFATDPAMLVRAGCKVHIYQGELDRAMTPEMGRLQAVRRTSALCIRASPPNHSPAQLPPHFSVLSAVAGLLCPHLACLAHRP